MDALSSDAAAPAGAFNWREELASWRAAWNWLPENPLVSYLGRTRLRAFARTPLWQRILLGVLVAGLLVGTVVAFVVDQSGGMGLQGLTYDIWVGVCASGMLVLYLLWAFQGLLTLVGDSMRVLAVPGKRAVALQLDDMLSLTRLSDRDILLAVLRVALPPFLLRVAVGAGLAWLGMLLVRSEAFQNFAAEGLWQTFILGPVTVGSMLLSGALASLCIALICISLGRSIRAESFVLSCTLLIALPQGTWLLVGGGVLSALGSMGGGPEELGFGSWLGLTLCAFLLAGFLLIANIGLAGEKSWWRGAMAAAWPMLLPASALIYLGIGAAIAMGGSSWPDWYSLLGWLYLSAWGSLAPLNLLALPSGVCVGFSPQSLMADGLAFDFVSPLSWIMTLLFQVALTIALFYLALQAVRLRRTEGS